MIGVIEQLATTRIAKWEWIMSSRTSRLFHFRVPIELEHSIRKAAMRRHLTKSDITSDGAVKDTGGQLAAAPICGYL
jgi:hypothetical protein